MTSPLTLPEPRDLSAIASGQQLRRPFQVLTIRHHAALISASFPSRRALMLRIGGWPKYGCIRA